MKELIPENAPTEGEQWSAIFSDVEKVIMPGVCTNSFGFSKVFPQQSIPICLSDYPLAKSVHACIFSCFEQLSVAFGRHVGKWNKLSGIYMGENHLQVFIIQV